MTIDVNHRLCTGCRVCELTCSLSHGAGVDLEASRIRVLQFPPGPIDVPVLCRQCKDAPCVKACPLDPPAIGVDESTGAIAINHDLCIECGACQKACTQSSAIWRHPSGKMLVCDLCGGDPACAKACPTGALSCLLGSSFDGAHYAVHPPKKVATDMASLFYPHRLKEEN